MQFLQSLPLGFKFFLQKLLIFSLLFILVSGTLGPYIIGTKLLYGWYFFIYANMGKLVLYSAIVFLLLTRKEIVDIKKFPLQKIQLVYLAFATFFYFLLYWLFHQLLSLPTFTTNIGLSLFSHLVLISMIILLVLGIFGFTFLRYFVHKFHKELVICLLIATIFYFSIFYVWGFWPYLSHFVLQVEYVLFSITFPPVQVFPPYTLSFPKFSITVAEACSGLDSIFLFTALYGIIWIIERKSLNARKMAIMFIPALIGTVAVNIIRVYLLILLGLLISPYVSLVLFHTYLGMILFIIYFFIFWKLLYKWMIG